MGLSDELQHAKAESARIASAIEELIERRERLLAPSRLDR